MIKRKIVLLGATGSIGTQALEVVRAHPNRFEMQVLTAATNAELLIQQALEFRPQAVVITDEGKYAEVKAALTGTSIEVLAGSAALEEVVQYDGVGLVISALVGSAGLRPTIAAIKAGKDIALANKETLVVGGQLVMELVSKHGVNLLPVDSEHSAIFQCLVGESNNPIERVYLTASGGPFRGKDRAYLASVSHEQALCHPNWVMGAKITIDSATLMNKGLEVIEAKWLFGLEARQIDVVVHPQSAVHSLVQFEDGSIKAQLGPADMRLPIQYALTYPNRVGNNFKRFNFADFPSLTFEQPDTDTFRNLALAYRALELGGNVPCILNAANEEVVAAFLKGGVGFLQMSDIIEETMATVGHIAKPSLDDYLRTDRESRAIAKALVIKNKTYII
ncbi:1-deoxy-D-xylulose 5-phosphate reductoisomerase [Parapedobacter pyrenivorans]|uniref:1-deoxy-D-xylulose 5-phosphate reductoisomerase n=1 Tax=Parapedobacter pyrenivorans TaxID=1305674 RepID=A0A917M8I6_9SPHI|nr:1-deoxy-D-xylulose-5-phosphate reductoisomerase [Parapedobacter pyrenivorans]GGG86024.1 1-deoxy-D-xylulose 5-phosphate reductoisomerase [Parapedobacter pyrenivorans]